MAWPLVRGAWCIVVVRGAWCVVVHSGGLALGAWCVVVYGSSHTHTPTHPHTHTPTHPHTHTPTYWVVVGGGGASTKFSLSQKSRTRTQRESTKFSQSQKAVVRVREGGGG